jgi:hypothetical protein
MVNIYAGPVFELTMEECAPCCVLVVDTNGKELLRRWKKKQY